MLIDNKEILIRLEWVGPFSLGPNGIEPNRVDGFGPKQRDLKKYHRKPGFYIIVGDHPIYGARSLLYIGQTKSFGRRFQEHYVWLSEEWRIEIYFAAYSKINMFENIEKLLIYAHSPPYNSKNISDPIINPSMRIWNVGRYWKLFPEISSLHPWYSNNSKT